MGKYHRSMYVDSPVSRCRSFNDCKLFMVNSACNYWYITVFSWSSSKILEEKVDLYCKITDKNSYCTLLSILEFRINSHYSCLSCSLLLLMAK